MLWLEYQDSSSQRSPTHKFPSTRSSDNSHDKAPPHSVVKSVYINTEVCPFSVSILKLKELQQLFGWSVCPVPAHHQVGGTGADVTEATVLTVNRLAAGPRRSTVDRRILSGTRPRQRLMFPPGGRKHTCSALTETSSPHVHNINADFSKCVASTEKNGPFSLFQ